MMTNQEKLQENYEDALFALLMGEFAQSEGERLMTENARLIEEPDAAVPPEIERRCLRLIARETSKRARAASAARLLPFLVRAALAALIAVMLFAAACALSPAFRAGALNLLMQIDERAASWQFVTESEDTSEAADRLPEITFGWLPDGYMLTEVSDRGRLAREYRCTDHQGNSITVSVFLNDASVFSMDIEDADVCEDITIQEHPGLLVVKKGVIRLSWAFSEPNCVFHVVSSDETEDVLMKIAESLSVE